MAKTTIRQRNAILGPMQQLYCLPGKKTDRTESESTTGHTKQHKCKCPGCSLVFKLQTPRLHSGTALDRQETAITTNFRPNLKVVWQGPSETSATQYNLGSIDNDFAVETTKKLKKSQTRNFWLSKSKVANERNPTSKLRNCYGSVPAKSIRERTGTVPQLIQ